MAIEVNPEDEQFQDEVLEVINSLKTFILESESLSGNRVSIPALIVGMEILVEEMQDNYQTLMEIN